LSTALCILSQAIAAPLLANDGQAVASFESNSDGKVTEHLTIRQQLVKLDEIKLEDQSRFKSELAKIRQQPVNADDIEYLTLLTAYEHALQGQYDKVVPTLTPLLESGANQEYLTRARILAVNVLLLSNNHSLVFSYFEKLVTSIPTISDPELLAQVIALVMFTYNQLERFELTLLYERYINYDVISAKLACRIRATSLDAKYLKPEIKVTEFDFRL